MAEERARDAGELFRDHADYVTRLVRRLGTPRAEIEDLVQDVFVVAHANGGYRPGPGRPTTWLAAITFRIHANRVRRSTRRKAASPFVPQLPAAPDSTPAEALELTRAVERVHEALQTLPLKKRIVFVLYELENETCEDIAADLKIPIGTVYSRLHKARDEFQRIYDRLTEAAPRKGHSKPCHV